VTSFLEARKAAGRQVLEAVRAKGVVRCAVEGLPSKEAVVGVAVLVVSFAFAFLVGCLVVTVMPAL